jgi:hypothetical protein
MTFIRTLAIAAATMAVSAQESRLPGVAEAMQTMVANREVSGAVTAVVSRDRLLHLEATGLADVAAKRPMTADTLFWIASMTKPVTGVSILMLQDEGKLKASDPVAKYLPAFAGLKTPSGKSADLTITQILTHTSGLGEADPAAAREARTLADLERPREGRRLYPDDPAGGPAQQRRQCGPPRVPAGRGGGARAVAAVPFLDADVPPIPADCQSSASGSTAGDLQTACDQRCLQWRAPATPSTPGGARHCCFADRQRCPVRSVRGRLVSSRVARGRRRCRAAPVVLPAL